MSESKDDCNADNEIYTFAGGLDMKRYLWSLGPQNGFNEKRLSLNS